MSSTPFSLIQIRVILGVTLITLVGLFPTVQLNRPMHNIIQKISGISKIRPNKLSAIFTQGRSLKNQLPSHGSIHYTTDDPIVEHRIILRNALAPLYLENNPAHRWWLVKYQAPQFKAKILTSNPLKQTQESGQNLVILKRDNLQ